MSGSPLVVAGLVLLSLAVVGYAFYTSLEREFLQPEGTWEAGRRTRRSQPGNGPPSEARRGRDGAVRRRRGGDPHAPPSERAGLDSSDDSDAEAHFAPPASDSRRASPGPASPAAGPIFLPTLLTSAPPDSPEEDPPAELRSLAGVSEAGRETEASDDEWTDLAEGLGESVLGR